MNCNILKLDRMVTAQYCECIKSTELLTLKWLLLCCMDFISINYFFKYSDGIFPDSSPTNRRKKT